MAGSSKLVRAGRAFVELFVNDNAMYRALDKASARFKAFGNAAVSVGSKAAATGGGVLAPIGRAFTDALTKGADIKAIATRFQQGTGAVSELAGAFEFAGVGVKEFGDVVGGVESKIIAAADANEELIDGLRGFGLRGRELIGLPLDKQLERIFAAMSKINASDFDLANQADQIFGAGVGARLVPYLKDGVDGLKRLKAEAQKSGAVMPTEDVERAATAMKAWDAIMVEVANTIISVGSALLPATDQTKSMSEQIRDVFSRGRQWVAANKEVIATVTQVTAGVVAGGVAVAGLGTGIKLLSPVLSLTVLGLKGVAAGLTLVFTPIGSLVAAVTGLGAAWLTCTDEGRKTASDLGKAFTSIGETFKASWGGIVAAAKKGDLATAFKIAGTGIKAIWFEMLVALGKAFAAFIEDNRNKLVALAALSGAWKGAKLGSRLGWWGAAAGGIVGAGGSALATDALLEELKGIGHNPKMEAAVAQAKRDVQNLVAKAKGADGPDLDESVRMGLEEERKRFEGYDQWKRGPKGGAEKARQEVFDRQRGIFSGPVAQQLGVGDKIASRQLNVQQNIDKGVQAVAKGVDALGKNVAVFGRK